jgi:hypothetical protein
MKSSLTNFLISLISFIVFFILFIFKLLGLFIFSWWFVFIPIIIVFGFKFILSISRFIYDRIMRWKYC